jgi:uncharacterized membrane protein YhaH (DUF805 family)
MSTTRRFSVRILFAYEALVLAFIRSIGSAFCNLADYEGRASRFEFWSWKLFVVLVQAFIGSYGTNLRLTVLFFLTPPDLALQVRRFHDIGRTGFWVIAYYTALLLFVAFLDESLVLALPFGFCLAIFLYWLIAKGTPGPNRYGRPPLVRRQSTQPAYPHP